MKQLDEIKELFESLPIRERGTLWTYIDWDNGAKLIDSVPRLIKALEKSRKQSKFLAKGWMNSHGAAPLFEHKYLIFRNYEEILDQPISDILEGKDQCSAQHD